MKKIKYLIALVIVAVASIQSTTVQKHCGEWSNWIQIPNEFAYRCRTCTEIVPNTFPPQFVTDSECQYQY